MSAIRIKASLSATSKPSCNASSIGRSSTAFVSRVEGLLAGPLPSRITLAPMIAVAQVGGALTVEQAVGLVRMLMTGAVPPEEIAALLSGLHRKGETVEEIAAFALTMRAAATPVRPKVSGAIGDTCGTGGDASRTVNASTAAALVLAAAGVPVAKHGNRALTSACGSADVLEALGARVDLGPQAVERCIEQASFGFLFAPRFHPATRYVQPVRKQLPHKTIFNLLGPLTNPAPVAVQLVGVYDEQWVEPMAEVLRLLGRRRALVVHGRTESGSGGIDECSLSGSTMFALLDESGAIRCGAIAPEDVGMARADVRELVGGDSVFNARVIAAMLRGEERGARRDFLVLNGAAALWAAGVASDLSAGVKRAAELIDGGAAYQKLQQFVRATQQETAGT